MFPIAFDMTPETGVLFSVVVGIFLIGSAIFYFLPDGVKKFLTSLYEFWKENKDK